MKAKITWKKGIRKIYFPVSGGTPDEEIKKIRAFYRLPKYSAIGFEQIQTFGEYASFLRQVFIEK